MEYFLFTVADQIKPAKIVQHRHRSPPEYLDPLLRECDVAAADVGECDRGVHAAQQALAADDVRGIQDRACQDQRDTPAGRDAAACWLGYRDHVARDESFAGLPPAAVAIWDRHLAYAAALGIAKTAVRVLPLGARSERLAWSAYGGSWHQIRVRYPGGLWGSSPWRVGFRGLVQVVLGGAVAYFLLTLRPGMAGDLNGVDPALARCRGMLLGAVVEGDAGRIGERELPTEARRAVLLQADLHELAEREVGGLAGRFLVD